jgi:hypothetical protein
MKSKGYNVIAVRTDTEADPMFLSEVGTWIFPIRMEFAKVFKRQKDAEQVAECKQKTVVSARTVMVIPA